MHRAAGAGRPGWTTRDSDAWRTRMIVDPPAWREGAEPLRIVTVQDAAGEVRGYALFRRKDNWAEGGPAGIVKVREAVALDAAATHRLWSFLLDLDLTATVEAPMLPVDDALLHLLVDPRAVVPKVNDNLWVRILDLPVALAGRSYSAPVDVVLDVTDTRLPANAGRWRLVTGDRQDDGTYPADVTRTHEDADVSLDVRELGAVYLGGRSLVAQARAGLVSEQTPRGAAECRRRVPLAGRAGLHVRLVATTGRPRRRERGRSGAGGAGRWLNGSATNASTSSRRLVDGVLTGADRDDVRVVVLTAQLCGREVPRERGAHAGRPCSRRSARRCPSRR